MEIENWRDIPGYEGRYQASDLGRVRSVARYVRTVSKHGTETRRRVPACVLKPQHAWNQNYVHVQLAGETCLVHHLVALTFIGPRPTGLEAAHNDGDSRNNRALNIRYATPKENSGDRVAHGTSGKGEANAVAKLTAEQVAYIRASKLPAAELAAAELAAAVKVHPNHISRIRRGERWGHVA